MATQKKSTSPDYYWVDFISELQNLVSVTDPLWQQYQDLLLGNIDYQLLYLVDWCTVALPDYTQPTAADFLSGAWITNFSLAALVAVFYNNCEDAP